MGVLDTELGQITDSINSARQSSENQLLQQEERLSRSEETSASLTLRLAKENATRTEQSKSVKSALQLHTIKVKALHAMVTKLQRENSSLEGQLSEVSAILPGLSASLISLERKIADKHVSSDVPQELGAKGRPVVSMVILPPRHIEPIRWRMLIPE